VYDKTHTPIPASKSRPELSIVVVDVRRLGVNFHDLLGGSKARPYGMIGASIQHATLPEPPLDPNELTQTTLATRTPHIFEFTEEERGKKVYFAACWQNERGERGPWSEIVSAIIP
jgi:hypothetical protein